MDTSTLEPDYLSEADEQLRQLLAEWAGPNDMTRLSDAQVKEMLQAPVDYTLSDDETYLILRKVEAKIHAAKENAEIADPPVPPSAGSPPPASVPPASPVLGFLGDIMHGSLHFPGSISTLWSILILLICSSTLVVLSVIAIRGIHVHVDGPNVAANLPAPSAAPSGGKESGKVAGGEGFPVASSPVARLARLAECVWVDAAKAPELNDELNSGRTLSLKSGLAEIVYQSGAKVLLQGPAEFAVRSGTSGYLERGKLTATVAEPKARGFEIHAAGMKFTDLGTEFGVFVADDGSQELDVFRGHVRAEAEGTAQNSEPNPKNEPGAKDSALSTPAPLTLSAGQAVRIASPAAVANGSKPFEPIAADEKRFVHVMPALKPMPIPIFSTGVGLNPSQRDPHWELVAISTDPSFEAQPARVCLTQKQAVHDEPGKAQWISNKGRSDMPKGCRWTLRSHVDLSRFDPATARIDGRMAIDDDLVEIRLNGNKVPMPKFPKTNLPSARWLPLKIEGGFTSGDNVLEIVIRNRSGGMGLCVDWKGTARPAK